MGAETAAVTLLGYAFKQGDSLLIVLLLFIGVVLVLSYVFIKVTLDKRLGEMLDIFSLQYVALRKRLETLTETEIAAAIAACEADLRRLESSHEETIQSHIRELSRLESRAARLASQLSAHSIPLPPPTLPEIQAPPTPPASPTSQE
jgi:hypothetical protein